MSYTYYRNLEKEVDTSQFDIIVDKLITDGRSNPVNKYRKYTNCSANQKE
jgi:hypothetical protein